MGVYNGEKFLREAVDSILHQTFTDFEFIIINDGSTDRTKAILETYHDPRMIVIHQANVGLTKSLNRGMGMAKGDYIARQDADDASMPDRLRVQVDFLASNINIALTGSAVNVIDGEGSHLTVFSPPCAFTTIREKLKQSNCFWHGSVMFKRSCLAELGGYSEFFTSAQDYDFWLRFAEKYELANLAIPLYTYRFNPDSITFKKIIVQRRNHLPEDALVQNFEKFVRSPLTLAERNDIVQSYKPWCRLLLKNNKDKDARLLMTAVFKYHPSLLFRLRFALSKNILSPSRLEGILDHA